MAEIRSLANHEAGKVGGVSAVSPFRCVSCVNDVGFFRCYF